MAAALPGMDVAENRPPEDSILLKYIIYTAFRALHDSVYLILCFLVHSIFYLSK